MKSESIFGEERVYGWLKQVSDRPIKIDSIQTCHSNGMKQRKERRKRETFADHIGLEKKWPTLTRTRNKSLDLGKCVFVC